jgi:hypothetical protein
MILDNKIYYNYKYNQNLETFIRNVIKGLYTFIRWCRRDLILIYHHILLIFYNLFEK